MSEAPRPGPKAPGLSPAWWLAMAFSAAMIAAGAAVGFLGPRLLAAHRPASTAPHAPVAGLASPPGAGKHAPPSPQGPP